MLSGHDRTLCNTSRMSLAFPSKAAPDENKLRGGYYTPARIAAFTAEWVLRAGPRTLEPSSGDGAILKYLAEKSRPTAIEIDSAEAAKASAITGVSVINADFFDWVSPSETGQYDGVAGNPPYIRFGNWKSDAREKAISFMKNAGLHPTRLTNAWVPFVVASVLLLRPGGRMGLVLPAELLQVGYAKELRHFLEQNCSEINIVSFRTLVFPGVQQEIVLLLAVRGDDLPWIRAVELESPEELADLKLSEIERAHPLTSDEKWTQHYLPTNQIETLRDLESDSRMMSIGDFADVNVGVVTGRNSFFCMTDEEARRLNLYEHTIPLVSRSNFLRSVTFGTSELELAIQRGGNTRLLSLPPDFPIETNESVKSYIMLGESEGVHQGYKCRIRKSWWSVPSVHIPDGFMLRQISKRLAISGNHANATSTDTVHRVFLKRDVSMDKLAVAAFNSFSFCSSELQGRSYGGGVLEIEPKEALRIRIPDPKLVSDALVKEVDRLLHDGQEQQASDLVDEELLVKQVGISASTLEEVKSAHERLLTRRLTRGGKR